MSFPKIILTGTVLVFIGIGVAAVVKKKQQAAALAPAVAESVVKAPAAEKPLEVRKTEKKKGKELRPESVALTQPAVAQFSFPAVATPVISTGTSQKDDFPQIDRIYQLFTTGPTKLPIVETITYSSSVPWLKGRPAWVADYASYYGTSRHFIARSLNGKPDYFTQKVTKDSRFNVFRKDKKISFHLLVDISRCKMGFYYIDHDTNERVLLKTYTVGLGRLDPNKASGSLTPLGKYSLGNKIAVYKPGDTGFYHGQNLEMMRVFGSRWIPLGEEIEKCTVPAKGYGIQGAPWNEDAANGRLIENRESIGTYNSDGCIQLADDDLGELFAIVVSKPAVIEIVKDFHEVQLPGVEVATPRR